MVCNGRLQHSSRLLTSAADFVDRARVWADALVWKECNGPGDLVEARHRVEARYGIPATLLRDLRYRPPKRIAAELYERLRIAYRNQCERELKRFEGELADASAQGRDETNSALVRQAVALARKDGETG